MITKGVKNVGRIDEVERIKEDITFLKNKHNKEKFYVDSEGKELNVLVYPKNLAKRIKHLPSSEQELIKARSKSVRGIIPKIRELKKEMKKLGASYSIFDDSRKTQLIDLFSRLHSIEDVHKIVLKEDGSIIYNDLKKFFHKNRDTIEKLQLDYEKNYKQIGVSRKRSRLEVLDLMLQRVIQAFKEVEGKKMLPFVKEAKGIISEARKEVDGERIKLDITGKIDITATIEMNKTVEELYQGLNFMTLLIGRVSSRMNINPLLLQYQLTNGWYSKFTGLKKNENMMDEEPDYPSKIILNWDDLVKKAKVKEKENVELKEKFNKQIQEAEVIEENVDYKKRLLSLIKERQGKII